MNKYLLILITCITIFSCKDSDDFSQENYSGDSYSFFQVDNPEFVVSPSNNSFDVVVGSTVLSSSDRTYTVSVDPATTAVSGTDFVISSNSVTIPAGEYFGVLSVTSDVQTVNPDGSTLVLNLDDDASFSNKVSILIKKECPVSSSLFTGNYLIEQTSDLLDGPTLADGAVVEVVADGLNRKFLTTNYPQYCSTLYEFVFKLDCGITIVPTQDNACACADGSGWFSAAEDNFTYDINDDSEFSIAFQDDTNEDCAAVATTTYKFTKQ